MATIEKRETASGITYRVRVRIKGRPAQTATFDRLTDARKWAQITEGGIKDGKHFHNSEAKKRTLNELVDRYIAKVAAHRPKDKAKLTAQLNWWKAQIGSYYLADITPARHRSLLGQTIIDSSLTLISTYTLATNA